MYHDTFDLINVSAGHGASYFIKIINDYTWHNHVYMMLKNQTLWASKENHEFGKESTWQDNENLLKLLVDMKTF